MKKILYVEDDALIARVYGNKLTAAGFDVVIANDGLEAVQRLREFTPDLVVLDLLMPKLTGVDVLKFMRGQQALKNTRIIVFSNSFLSNLVEQVARIGVEEALVKAAVTPVQLVQVINRALDGGPHAFLTADDINRRLDSNFPVAPPQPGSPPSPVSETLQASVVPPLVSTAVAKPARQITPAAVVAAQSSAPPATTPSSYDDRARVEFQARAPGILENMRQICGEFLEASQTPVEPRKLQDLRRKIGFVAQTLGLAGRRQLAQLCSAFEAMLFELVENPQLLTDSIRQTIASTVAVLGEGFASDTPPDASAAPKKVLLVDDDAVTSRAVVLALGRAQLAATCVTDPFDGMKRLQDSAFDLVLLDVDMPGMDGITLCQQMRALPRHKSTPVVFVTGQSDFKTRTRAVLSGGDDLIAKPILANELCVKALCHLAKRR